MSNYGKKITSGECRNCKYKETCGTPGRKEPCASKESLNEKKNPRFRSRWYGYEQGDGTLELATNAICNCCHGIGSVLQFEIPSTLFHNGKTLTTKYRTIWICPECLEKLKKALDTHAIGDRL